MDSRYVKIDAEKIDMSLIAEAGMIIKKGGLVAFPTETVYGLGGNALDPAASKKIYEAKGRPSDNPLIVHIAKLDSLYEIADSIPPAALKLADRYWPGPLTMIFDKKPLVPKETTGGLDTVAVRFPSHPVAQALIEASGGFIAAPSANISGRPSPTSGEHVFADMNGRIDMIIDSGRCDIGLESTIIDFTDEVPMMLRPGYVSSAMLEETVGSVGVDPAVSGSVNDGIRPKAPGMKYRHYAPKGTLSIVSGDSEKVISYIRERIDTKITGVRIGVLACTKDEECYKGADLVAALGNADDEAMIASRLYDVLRRCDDEGIDEIYSEEFDTPNLGPAIMNRLIKAAGHKIINV